MPVNSGLFYISAILRKVISKLNNYAVINENCFSHKLFLLSGLSNTKK